MADDGDFTGNNMDGGQDVCSFFASFINQRRSVERLINWLRQSQTTCVGETCFGHPSGFPGTEYSRPADTSITDQGDSSQAEPFALAMLFAIGLLTLFTLSMSQGRRLASNESSNKRNRTSRDDNQDDDYQGARRDDGDDHTRPAI